MRQRHRTGKVAAMKAKSAPPKPAAPAAPSYSGPSTSHEMRELLPRSAKLTELDRQLKLTKTSTASLGRFDNKLDGEAVREKGKKRQFDSNEITDSKSEREKYFSVLQSMDNDEKANRAKEGRSEELVNARKAIRSASKGKGSASLAGAEKKNKIDAKTGRSGGFKAGRGGSSSSRGRGGSSSSGGRGGRGGKTSSSLSRGKKGK